MIRDCLRFLYRQMPKGAQRAALVWRRSPIWLRTGVLFIHIPKAAGTSINHALYGRFMGHVRALDVKRWGSSALNALPSFAVTRNPWARLVSSYRFARQGRGVGGPEQAAVHRPEQYRVPEFDSFETFVTKWLTQRDVTKLDGIFQPQSLFLCDEGGRLLVDHVGRLENLEPTYDFISKHMRSKVKFGVSNRSGESVDFRRFYTPELVTVVGHVYREDIERFNYRYDCCFPS